jgi:hypothetical protein
VRLSLPSGELPIPEGVLQRAPLAGHFSFANS